MSNEFYLTLTRHPDPAAVADALGAGLRAQGYTPYDPFPGGNGPARIWTSKVTAFVAPPRAGWVCIIGRVPVAALAKAGATLGSPMLHLWLTPEIWGYLLFVDGDEAMDMTALDGFLRPSRTLDDLRRAVAGSLDNMPLDPIDPTEGALPENIIIMADEHNVDMDKAQKMIDKYTGKLLGKLGKRGGSAERAEQTAALNALQGVPSIWESACGRRLRAFAACLALPENWHRPGLETIRAAYAVVRRKRANPNATLLASDISAHAALPDAEAYLPVYFGLAG